jgi:hypothetical protein
MAMEPLTGKLTAGLAGLSSPARISATGEGAPFSQALVRVASASAAGAHANPGEPVREVPVAAAPADARSGSSLGQQILDNIENLHRSDQSLSRSSMTSPSRPAPGPDLVVRTTMLAPGPAAAPLAAGGPWELRSRNASGGSDPGDFNAMLHALEQVSAHAIQVSVVSKTTGSFTSSLNKLMSAT